MKLTACPNCRFKKARMWTQRKNIAHDGEKFTHCKVSTVIDCFHCKTQTIIPVGEEEIDHERIREANPEVDAGTV